MSIGLVVLLLASGGLATSLAEYKFQYNLVDYVVEGVKKLLGLEKKVQADVKSEVGKVEGSVKEEVQDIKKAL